MSLGSRCFEALIKRGTKTLVGDIFTIDVFFFFFVNILHDTLKHFKLRIKLECTRATTTFKHVANDKKRSNIMITSRLIFAYKISNLGSNSSHVRGGVIVIQVWYSFCNLLLIEKVASKALDNNKYLLVWSKMHYSTIGPKVFVMLLWQ
jgi:hypothetical protein